MMPSRGWHVSRGCLPRLPHVQSRNLSSTTARIRPSRPLRTAPSQRIPRWRLSSPIAPASLSSIRHASTTPSSTPAPQSATQEPTASAATDSSSFPNLDTITLDNIDLSTTSDITQIPEKIGYLHEIGLNYGWGPTSALEFAIEHIHMYTGLPWWGSVALTAATIRLVLLPMFIRSSDMTARTQAMMSVTKPITERMNEARRNQDNMAMQTALAELREVRSRAGLSLPAQMAPMLLQGVIGYCGFKLTRAMANLPVPALKTDGFLWLQDMTFSDPFLILPIAMAGTIHMLVRMGGESGAAGTDQMAPGVKNLMLWGMPGIILLTMGYQSGLVCVWFASGGLLGIVQSLALRNENIRKRLGIAPLYRANQQDFDQGVMGDVFKSMYRQSGGSTGGSSGGAATHRSAGGAKNNASWMNYQSPNLRRNMNSSGKVIDVNPVQKSSTGTSSSDPNMIQPNAPSQEKPGNVFSQASEKFKAWRSQELSEEEKLQKRKADYKRRAQAFEKKFQERGRR